MASVPGAGTVSGISAFASVQASLGLSLYQFTSSDKGDKKPKLEKFDPSGQPQRAAPSPPKVKISKSTAEWISNHPRIIAARKAAGLPDIPPQVEARIKRRDEKAAKKVVPIPTSPAQAPPSSVAPPITLPGPSTTPAAAPKPRKPKPTAQEKLAAATAAQEELLRIQAQRNKIKQRRQARSGPEQTAPGEELENIEKEEKKVERQLRALRRSKTKALATGAKAEGKGTRKVKKPVP